MNIKKYAFKMYRLIYHFPFNNSKHGKISIRNDGSILINCKIKSRGDNNTIIFARGGVYRNCCFELYGSNNCIEFGEECNATKASFYIENSNNNIITGDRTSYAGRIHIACTESQTISVGDDCLFSSDIVIRSGDSHSIIDLDGNRINHAAKVEIGNHVWVGYRALINKGVCIPENCVIGTGAVLTRTFTEGNCVIAGVPAKIVKHNVNWIKERI